MELFNHIFEITGMFLGSSAASVLAIRIIDRRKFSLERQKLNFETQEIVRSTYSNFVADLRKRIDELETQVNKLNSEKQSYEKMKRSLEKRIRALELENTFLLKNEKELRTELASLKLKLNLPKSS